MWGGPHCPPFLCASMHSLGVVIEHSVSNCSVGAIGFIGFNIFIFAIFFCKNTRKTAKVKINVILFLLRILILPYKLHFIPGHKNFKRPSRDVFFQSAIFLCKNTKKSPKMKIIVILFQSKRAALGRQPKSSSYLSRSGNVYNISLLSFL